MFHSIENKKNKKQKQKIEKKKKRWEGEELPSGGRYFDSMETNFHVSKVSFPSYLQFWISQSMWKIEKYKAKKIAMFYL
jgi:hypothetical protein